MDYGSLDDIMAGLIAAEQARLDAAEQARLREERRRLIQDRWVHGGAGLGERRWDPLCLCWLACDWKLPAPAASPSTLLIPPAPSPAPPPTV